MASIAGKGHDSWSKRPGPWMALQSAASEAVLAPGALVCLAASGLVDESLAASEAALQVAVACWLGLSLVTSLVRSYTPVPLRLLNHVAWVVIPTVAAAAAWGRPAVLPIGIYIFARTAFVMLGSMFRSSPTLEMLESARKVGGAMPPAGVPVLPRARILLASDAVPPKVRAASRAAPGRPAPAIPRPRPAHRGSSSRPRPLGRAPGRERGCFRPQATVPLAPLFFFPRGAPKLVFRPSAASCAAAPPPVRFRVDSPLQLARRCRRAPGATRATGDACCRVTTPPAASAATGAAPPRLPRPPPARPSCPDPGLSRAVDPGRQAPRGGAARPAPAGPARGQGRPLLRCCCRGSSQPPSAAARRRAALPPPHALLPPGPARPSPARPRSAPLSPAPLALRPQLDGVAVFSKHACRELTAKGHTVHVLTSVPGEERIEGCEVTRLFGIRPQYYPEHSLTVPMPWDLPIVFARVRPHCVHLMDASMFLSGSLSFFCWLFEIPCVMSHHTRIDMYATYILPGIGSLVPNTLMYLYRRLTTGFAPTNLAVCTSLANQMVDHFGCRPHRVAIWHSGTDTRSFNPKLRSDETRLEILSAPDVDQEEAEAAAKAAGKAAPRRPAPADLPIVLYVGRIAPEKDVDIIADMARLVNPPDRPPRCRIAVVGKGPTMPALRESLRGTGVALLGPRYNKDLQLHYAAADVFLTTCTTEAFCLVGLEAMASGLPVVGPDSGGVMELFDEGVEGLFYKPRSAADAARAVVEAIEKHGAAKTDCPMRLAARAKVEAQSWELTYRQAAFWYRDQILAY